VGLCFENALWRPQFRCLRVVFISGFVRCRTRGPTG
jgi:hypothetical protein